MRQFTYLFIFLLFSCKQSLPKIKIDDIYGHRDFINSKIDSCKTDEEKIEVISELISLYKEKSRQLDNKSTHCVYYIGNLYNKSIQCIGYFYDTISKKPTNENQYINYLDSARYYSTMLLSMDSTYSWAINLYSTSFVDQVSLKNRYSYIHSYLVKNEKFNENGLEELNRNAGILSLYMNRKFEHLDPEICTLFLEVYHFVLPYLYQSSVNDPRFKFNPLANPDYANELVKVNNALARLSNDGYNKEFYEQWVERNSDYVKHANEYIAFLNQEEQNRKLKASGNCNSDRHIYFIRERFNSTGKRITDLVLEESNGVCSYSWRVTCVTEYGRLAICYVSTSLNPDTYDIQIASANCQTY